MKRSDLSPAAIAKAMGISEPCLWWLAHHINRLYKPRRKKLIKGKARPIDPPTPWLKRTLRKLHRFLQVIRPAHRSVHGGASGRSCVTAANVHKGQHFLLTRDMHKCYQSITTDMSRVSMLRQDFRRDTAYLLSLLFTRLGIIPHGSPISSDALNVFLFQNDRRLLRRTARLGAKSTRTYDDIVVSSQNAEAVDELAVAMEAEITRCGLRVSEKKREHHGLQMPHQVQTVHGLVINNPRGIGLTREQRHKALQLGESYVGAAKCVAPESLEAVAYKRRQLVGWINYASQIQFSPAKHLSRLLQQGDAFVARRLRHAGVTRTRKWWVLSKRRNRARAVAARWAGALSGASRKALAA